MKLFYFLLASFILFTANLHSQNDLHCGTDKIMDAFYKKNPDAKAKAAQRDLDAAKQFHKTASVVTYTIPMVFHILHVGGPENISDAQVKDGVRILNRDYGLRNADTSDIISSFKSLADSINIQFALATIDPNGNCTTGIIHHNDIATDWYDTSSYNYTWDATKYLNVYIVRTITFGNGFGAAGYTYFPGTWPDGYQNDAIVVLNNYFGSIGTGNNFLSRVLTHEVGHWFNLYHVFGNTNGAAVDCSGDDQVGDTPQTAGYLLCPDKTDPSTYQICNAGADENFQNYMDYSYCCRMFTQGQAARMQASVQSSVSMRNNLWANSNLIATGVLNPISPCVPEADFTYNHAKICVGLPVTFSDNSWNSHPTTYKWSFPGGVPATSTDSMPAVTYSATGVYAVSYTSTTSAGSSSITKTNIITVINNTATYLNWWADSFENAPIPNNDWTVENTSGGANWTQSADAAYTGNYSAELPILNNTRLTVASMISPSINLSTILSPYLFFRVAAAESNPNHINTLKVYYTIDCGETWVEIYSKTGSALLTSSSNVSPFIPLQSEWRLETIHLSNIMSSTSASFKFSYLRDTLSAPNNTFLEDINVSGITGISTIENITELSLFPNPANGAATISFDLNTNRYVQINVNDILGRTIETSVNEELQAGKHSFIIGNDKKLAAGIYMVNMSLNNNKITRKLIVE